MKTCFVCKQEKEITDFYISGKGKVITPCKECRKARDIEKHHLYADVKNSTSRKHHHANKERMSLKRKKYYAENKDKCNAYSRNYYKTHTDEQKAIQYARYRENPDLQLRRYGLKRGDYDKLLSGQNGTCAICNSPKPGGRYGTRFHVDHCHDSKVVRGLLCSRCNCGIGNLKDSVELTLKAHRYLIPHPNILPGF